MYYIPIQICNYVQYNISKSAMACVHTTPEGRQHQRAVSLCTSPILMGVIINISARWQYTYHVSALTTVVSAYASKLSQRSKGTPG